MNVVMSQVKQISTAVGDVDMGAGTNMLRHTVLFEEVRKVIVDQSC